MVFKVRGKGIVQMTTAHKSFIFGFVDWLKIQLFFQLFDKHPLRLDQLGGLGESGAFFSAFKPSEKVI